MTAINGSEIRLKRLRDETSATYGIAPAIAVSGFGIIGNLILMSYLIKRVKKSFGKKFLLTLNILDMTVCLVTIAAMSVLLFERENSSHKISYFIKQFHSVLVELSGITTCFLCGLRTISISHPFYIVCHIKVLVAFGTICLYLVLKVLITSFESALSETAQKKDNEGEVSTPATISVVEVSLMVVFILTCTVACAIKLRRSTQDTSKNNTDSKRKATIMILILCALFVLLNTFWCVLLFSAMFLERGEDLAYVTMATYIPMSVNSACNPLVYFTRNSDMKQYLTGLINKFMCFRRTRLTRAVTQIEFQNYVIK